MRFGVVHFLSNLASDFKIWRALSSRISRRWSVESQPTFRRNISPPSWSRDLLSRRYLARLNLRPWRWRRYIRPKRRLTFNGLHGVKTTVVRTSGPTYDFKISSHWSDITTVLHETYIQICRFTDCSKAFDSFHKCDVILISTRLFEMYSNVMNIWRNIMNNNYCPCVFHQFIYICSTLKIFVFQCGVDMPLSHTRLSRN
jgi:hypothetical protein